MHVANSAKADAGSVLGRLFAEWQSADGVGNVVRNYLPQSSVFVNQLHMLLQRTCNKL